MKISPDYHLYDDGVYNWTPERSEMAWTIAKGKLIEAVKSDQYQTVTFMGGIPGAGKSTWLENNYDPKHIFFDATLTKKSGYRGRKALVELVRSVSNNIPIRIFFLNTSFSVCVERNSKRAESRKVPAETMERMFQEVLELGFPKKEEGFTEVKIFSCNQ